MMGLRNLEYLDLKVHDHVALVTLRREQALNAINLALMAELMSVMKELDDADSVRVTVLTGSDKAFAAGADIAEMAEVGAMEIKQRNQFLEWDAFARLRKPIIAAVAGYALGGGCELALACDIIIASVNARFGQPEINLGVMPGAGGTQRLTRAVGKSRAMEMLLTGDVISADEAEQMGLVSRVVPTGACVSEALRLAHQIANKPPLAVQAIKESVRQVFETTLSVGMEYERNLFYLLFSSRDKAEGMQAFIEKRRPSFEGK